MAWTKDQRMARHALRMRANYKWKWILDLDDREKMIQTELEDVFKKSKPFEPDP